MLDDALPLCRLPAVLTAAIALSGCAFQLTAERTGAPECKSDGDCSLIRICNPITSTCELQPPPSRDWVLSGPFDCQIGVTQWAAVSVSAKWPPYQSNGYSVGADDIRISHQCETYDDGRELDFRLVGGRQENRSFGMVGFYEIIIKVPDSARALGTWQVQTISSALLFCPTYAHDPDAGPLPGDPFSNEGVEGCLQLFEMPNVRLTISAVGDAQIAGSLRADLVPFVILFEPSDGGPR